MSKELKENYKKHTAIFYVLGAGFSFALMTVSVRMAGNLPTMQKAFFRNSVSVVYSSIMLLQSSQKFHFEKRNLKDLILRSFFGTTGMICNYYSIDRLNIADANILNKLSPFFAIIFSYFLLKEKPNKIEWGCVITAFIGAVFVVKPSFHMQAIYALIGLSGGMLAGAAYTFLRKLGKNGERGTVVIFFFSASSSLAIFPFLVMGYQPMKLWQLLWLLGAGLAATGGQICITKAYSLAPAKEISVFDYSQVIFAAFLGFVLFGQIPDILSFIGYVIIIGSAVYKWKYVETYS